MIKTQWICQFWLGKSHPLHLDDVDGRLEDSETCSVGGLPSGKPSPCANRKITVRQKWLNPSKSTISTGPFSSLQTVNVYRLGSAVSTSWR
jgi:hypothetical protein